MKLRIQLNVKFRAFFVTFGQIDQQWEYPLSQFGIPQAHPQTVLNFNGRGVWLNVALVR